MLLDRYALTDPADGHATGVFTDPELQSLYTTLVDQGLTSLEKGSRNHLRAFTKQLVNNGATYTPAHISQAAYEAIVSSGVERGNDG